MPKKLTKEEFISKAINIHGNRYDYSLVNYINSTTKIDIICFEHGVFKQRPINHSCGQGCFRCGKTLLAKQFSLSLEEFKEKANMRYGNYYDYSKIKYVNSGTKVEIICKRHGSFWTTPGNHLYQNCACKKCRTKTTEQFISEAVEVHKNVYNYDLVLYEHGAEKVKIICSIHGVFEQEPRCHLKRQGCPNCKFDKDRKTTEQFKIDAIKIHGEIYDYSQVVYINNKKPVEIICKKHGVFKQTPICHLKGSGCKKCNIQISNKEKYWLKVLQVPVEQHYINVENKKYFLDGFNPDTNTVYEFLGDYWHGNLKRYDGDFINSVSNKSMKQLNEETMNRLTKLNQYYNVVYIWESDYNKYKNNPLSLTGSFIPMLSTTNT